MTSRITRITGALLAVAAVAATTSLATANPGATAAGGGGGNCNDNWPPHSNWGNGWWNNGDGGRNWNGWGDGNGYFDGSSSDQGCGDGSSSSARAAAAGKVAKVRVAVNRRTGSQCRHLSPSGRFGALGRCGYVHWMKAKGTTSWRFDVPSRLGRGHYRLYRSAVDAAGNKEHMHHLDVQIK
jgi:hypothetical protein